MPTRDGAGLRYRRRMELPPVDLTSLPPGTRTDLEILRLEGARLEPRDGWIVVRSPEQAEYHWGNFIQVTTGDVEDADAWLARFAAEFPDAAWLTIGLPRAPRGRRWQELGLEPEQDDVLALRGLPQSRPARQGYQSRPLAGDDWDQLVEVDLRERADAVGSMSASYLRFAHDRSRARQRLVAQGDLAWFGSFSPGGALVSSLGVTVLGDDRRLARYQSVVTAPKHRRQGLAGYLLGQAARWAAYQGAQEFVIVTELTNPAGRLYRRVGFTPAPSNISVYRPPTE